MFGISEINHHVSITYTYSSGDKGKVRLLTVEKVKNMTL